MYYIQYNEIDLTDIVKVRSVEMPSLPSIEHSSKDVFERNGNVFNGVSYNNRNIKLVFIIQPDNPEDYEMYVNDVKRAFYTKEECRLFCGDVSLYMWCVPVDEVVINELGNYCAEAEVELIAYDPYWYSIGSNVVNNEDQQKFSVINESDVAVYPVFQIGFTKDTTFVQIENQTNGERLLIGGIPSVEENIIKKDSKILADYCESTSGWTKTVAPIEADRSTDGTITVNSGAWGLVLSDSGSGSTTWKGAAYKKSLDQPVKDFKVRVGMVHNSGGTNGDPSRPYENDYTTDGTTKTTYYKVTASKGAILRKDKKSKAEKLATIPKNTKLYPISVSNGWIQVNYSSKTGWCLASELKKYVTDTTRTECNVVVTKNTALRNTPYKTAKNNCTIPAGTLLRIQMYPRYPEAHTNPDLIGIYYKLDKSYNGKTGYVLIEDVIPASDYEIDYEVEQNTADDKTGVVELYGFSSDSTQLFKLSMNDKSEWYEHTYPSITKNGAVFLEDSSTTQNPNTYTDYSDSGKDVDTLLSGKVNNGWQEFNGELYIERVNNSWYAYVQKKVDGKITKEIKSKTITDSKNGDKTLSYLVIYIGTSKSGSSDSNTLNKCSDMAISHIEVKTATEIDKSISYNFIEFEVGDILTIDHSVPSVRLNDVEHNELIDVGSAFFKLEPGENVIKVASDDTPNVDVLWTNKHL